MPSTLTFDPVTEICELHISGVLGHAEFTGQQDQIAAHIAAGHQPLMLVVLDDFVGWEKGASWDNLDFMFSHGEKIRRIAIVGDKQWEDQVKMFAGAGFRSAAVGYFDTGLSEAARAWLLG